MAINFPDSPTTGDSFTAAGRTWVWDGTTWNNEPLVEFDTVQFDTTAGAIAGTGELAWNADMETLDLGLDTNVTLQVGQEHVIRVKNGNAEAAIPNGTVVMFIGATGDTVRVAPMVANGSVSPEYLVGITTEEIAADGFGFVTQFGFVNGLNTIAWPSGTVLYADPAVNGGLTATEPEAPNLKLPIAAVTRSHGTTGRLLVRLQTGYKIDNLHNVQIATPVHGQVLKYDDAQLRWENADLTTADLTDFDISDPTAGQTLSYDDVTGKWVNANAAAGGETISSFLLMGA